MKFIFRILLCTVLFTACNTVENNLIRIEGNAQGTSYHISYFTEYNINYQQGIDSILRAIDTSMSTWVPVSVISRINNNDSSVLADNYFMDVFKKATDVSERTGGLFDVTVGPLVNAWGFGFSKKATVDSSMIDSLLQFVGYKMIRLEGQKIIKAKPQLKIDLNAIAQGYTVDVIANYLENKGVHHYLVELGGELKAKGKKGNDEWKVGIDKPGENAADERKLEAIISLNNRAMATSGNYRKFYEEGGQKYSHIIDPRTGYPAKQNVLSATVFADDCMTADAYATAMMIMGLERSKQFLIDNRDLNLEVYFIYDDKGNWKTYASETLKNGIQEIN